MGSKVNRRRRWAAAIFLLLAFAMLVAGQTFLRTHLDRFGFVFYWMACFFFTALAAIFALADFAAVRRQAREDQRKVLEEALLAIARERTENPREPPRHDGGPA